jgi:SNF2 family DNA or RNA helicase
MATIKAEMDALRLTNADLEAEAATLAARQRAVDSMLYESRQKVRSLQKSLEDADRKHTQAMMVAEMEEQFRTTVAEWDEITRNAPWRDAALEHQFEGARRIAFSRSIILADVMGLGKTLEAIMALDYLMAAQPEPSIELIDRKGYHRYSEDKAETCASCKVIAEKPDGPTYGDLNYDHYGDYYEQREIPAAGRKILYVAPVSLIRNVEREFGKWAPYREKPVVLSGYSKNQRRMALDVVKQLDKSVVLVNYEAWRKDMSLLDELIAVGFDTVVIDEAHNIKDRGSVGYRGVRAIIDGVRYDGKGNVLTQGTPILNVIPMTGSPILNRPQELYTLLTLVDKLQFPPTTQGENAWLRDYCYQDSYTKKWYFRPGGLESLARKISNRFIRRTREDAGIELPPQEIIVHELQVDEEMYPNQAKVRQEMRDNAMILLDPARGTAVVASVMLAVYLRLRQIETWPDGITLKDEDGNVLQTIDVKESQKIDYIIHPDGQGDFGGLLPEICPEERTVIYSQFKPPLLEMRDRAVEAGIRTVILDGSTPQKVRDEIQIDFDRSLTKREDAKWDLVLCNYKVGGVGMNFTGATQTIILDEEWNPGKRDQAYDRTNRMGQTEETTVHVIRDKGTIDTWLADIIEEKETMIGGFNTQMSATEFFEALREGAM